MSSSNIPDRDKLKEAVRQQWTDSAAPWRKWYPKYAVQNQAATEMLVRAVQVTPGMHILDLASGTGEPALTLAATVGQDGHVTATDLVPEMLAGAEENARARGLTNMTFQQSDAENLPFPDQSFDAVTCRCGVMFFPNVLQALKQIRRVLKPGGRVTLLVWGPSGPNNSFTTVTEALSKYAPPLPPDPSSLNPQRFAQAGALVAVLREAGFQHVQEETHTVPWAWPGSAAELWDYSRDQTRTRSILERIPAQQLEQAINGALASIEEYNDGQQINFSAVIIIASGTS